jgi:hypothetical protein
MKTMHYKRLGQIVCVSVLLLGIHSLGFAAKQDDDIRSPLGCKDVGYDFDLKVLKILPAKVGDSQSLYFVFNKTKKPINLYQMHQSESSQSVYLNHTIPPRKWAVLSSSERMNYICTAKEGKFTQGRILNCQDGLKVCEYARVKYGMNNRGNYWLANGNTRGGAVRQVINYGIIPR